MLKKVFLKGVISNTTIGFNEIKKDVYYIKKKGFIKNPL